jgi:hypothetical protein
MEAPDPSCHFNEGGRELASIVFDMSYIVTRMNDNHTTLADNETKLDAGDKKKLKAEIDKIVQWLYTGYTGVGWFYCAMEAWIRGGFGEDARRTSGMYGASAMSLVIHTVTEAC